MRLCSGVDRIFAYHNFNAIANFLTETEMKLLTNFTISRKMLPQVLYRTITVVATFPPLLKLAIHILNHTWLPLVRNVLGISKPPRLPKKPWKKG